MCTGGQQLAGGLRRGLCVRLVQVTGAGRRPVGAAAVPLDGAAGLDLGAGGVGRGLGAGVVDQAQGGAATAALRRLLGRHRAQRLTLRGASALAAGADSSAAEGSFFIAASSQIASSHLRRSVLVLWSSVPAVSGAW
jgi:hypothetical protein